MNWTIADRAIKDNEDGTESLVMTLRSTKTLAGGATLHVGQFVYELASPTADQKTAFVNKANVVLSIALALAPAASTTAAASAK